MAQAANRSRVFHRHLKATYPTADESSGAWIVDGQGERYLDASGGAAVSCLGHGHPKVIAAIKDQLDRMAFAHTAFFTNEPAERLAEALGMVRSGELDLRPVGAGSTVALPPRLFVVGQSILTAELGPVLEPADLDTLRELVICTASRRRVLRDSPTAPRTRPFRRGWPRTTRHRHAR